MTQKEEVQLIYKDEGYAIIGACFAVYRNKGCGSLEPVYHACLEIEFQRVPFQSQPPQTLQYRGRTLVQTFTPELGLLVNFGHYPRLEYERLLSRNQQLADVHL
jgi:hypothetical protein